MEAASVHIRVAVRSDPLAPQALVEEVGRPAAGAVTLFLGTARDHSEGRTDVTHLDYEAYAGHVEAALATIAEEAASKWQLLAIAVEHRVGRVDVGQPSVAVAVSSEHRADALEAARYVIDELKQRAPIWKRESWPGGSEWIEGA